MRTTMLAWLPLLVLGGCIVCESRRVPVHRPVPQESESSSEEEEQETVNYYAAEPSEEEDHRVVLVSSADRYNGLYGQPSPTARASSSAHQDNYIPRGSKDHHVQTRTKETPRQPPVQTIRNYNKVNDDGSFTFGYEAADGSFKEETRGTDCVVRGKYGYVDPDGNKREFTYVSGNPCDPNAPKEEDEEEEERESHEAPDQPANYPTRPVVQVRRPLPTSAPKQTVTLFQNNYEREEEQPEPEQLLRVTPQPYRRPTYITRPQYVPQEASSAYSRQQLQPSTTPASLIYKSSVHPVSITPRPVSVAPTPRSQLPATTYRPQLLQVSATPRPLLYSKQPSAVSTPKNDFESEFQRFQQENDVVSSTTTPRPKAVLDPNQVYSTALIYDPNTGQYNNQLYQSLPQGDVLLKQRIQPYVQQPRTPVLNIQQLRQQSPLYSQNLRPQQQQVNQQRDFQAAYRQQQQELQFQNSAQLYAQQQRARVQQEQQQHQQQQQQQQQQARQQPVYYIQPSSDGTGALATSQLDAFLRGHNIQF